MVNTIIKKFKDLKDLFTRRKLKKTSQNLKNEFRRSRTISGISSL